MLNELFTITIYCEVWGDERNPKMSVSHKVEHLSGYDLAYTVQTLMHGLQPPYKLEITPEGGKS